MCTFGKIGKTYSMSTKDTLGVRKKSLAEVKMITREERLKILQQIESLSLRQAEQSTGIPFATLRSWRQKYKDDVWETKNRFGDAIYDQSVQKEFSAEHHEVLRQSFEVYFLIIKQLKRQIPKEGNTIRLSSALREIREIIKPVISSAPEKGNIQNFLQLINQMIISDEKREDTAIGDPKEPAESCDS